MNHILAYIDPGTGSIILQTILGGAAGVFVGIKLFGRRLLSFFTFWKRDAPTETPAPAVDES